MLASLLHKRGYNIDVFEQRDDPRYAGVVGGRSINLALSYRGLCALEAVGLADDVLTMSVPMRGRMIHSKSGDTMFQPYGVDDAQAINSVSRGGLNIALLTAAAKHANVRLHFNAKCVDVHPETGRVDFIDTREKKPFSADGDVVFSADGAFSAVRRAMQKLDRFDYRQDYLEHGYKELTIPAAENGGHRMEKNALHIWPRKSFMMTALPNLDGSYTCTLFWPFEGPNSFAAIHDEGTLRQFFDAQFPDAVSLMPTLAPDYFTNPTGSMVTVRCHPWSTAGRVLLLGDAAHAVVPFYGQGMNATFEDVLVLDECMERHGSDWAKVFAAFESSRRPNTDALADLAVSNFVEMRDHTGSRRFLWKKKAEKLLAKSLPGWFVPLYTMVSFTRIPYAEAVQRSRRQYQWVFGALLTLFIILVMASWAILIR